MCVAEPGFPFNASVEQVSTKKNRIPSTETEKEERGKKEKETQI